MTNKIIDIEAIANDATSAASDAVQLPRMYVAQAFVALVHGLAEGSITVDQAKTELLPELLSTVERIGVQKAFVALKNAGVVKDLDALEAAPAGITKH